MIHGFDESSRQKDQCERQTWDENEERSFEIEWRSLSDKQSERGDDEQVSGSGQRVQSARAKPVQTLDCRMSASYGRKAERENKSRQQQQASAPLGAAHPYRKWNRNAQPTAAVTVPPARTANLPHGDVPRGRGHDHEKWQIDRRSRRQSSVEGYHQAKNEAEERDPSFYTRQGNARHAQSAS